MNDIDAASCHLTAFERTSQQCCQQEVATNFQAISLQVVKASDCLLLCMDNQNAVSMPAR